MTFDELDQHATFWNDDHFGTSIVENDGMAKFVATVQTAMFFAASGSTRTCVNAREHASSSAAELLWEHGDECEDSTEQTAQDDNLVDEDEAEQWSISEGQSVLYVILNTRREDIVPADELDMSDDENEETNFTTFRAFLSFSKVAIAFGVERYDGSHHYGAGRGRGRGPFVCAWETMIPEAIAVTYEVIRGCHISASSDCYYVSAPKSHGFGMNLEKLCIDSWTNLLCHDFQRTIRWLHSPSTRFYLRARRCAIFQVMIIDR